MNKNGRGSKKLGFPLVISVIIFVLLIIGILVAWKVTRHQTNSLAKTFFHKEVDKIVSLIEERRQVYLDTIYGGVALFAASKSVERDEWQKFVEKNKLFERCPGMATLRFVEYVPAAKKEEFILSVRADTSLNPAGYPDFKIHPEEDLPEYFVVKYVEPFAGNEKMLGLNLGWEPLRQKAMESARDLGEPTATPKIFLVTAPHEPGFILFLPIYRNGAPIGTVEERRAALLGFVDAAVTCREFFTGIFGEAGAHAKIDIHIFDEDFLTMDHLLYDDDSGLFTLKDKGIPLFEAFRKIHVTDQTWSIHLTTIPGFGLEPWQVRLPFFVIAAGSLFTFFVTGFFYFLLSGREGALGLARQMAFDLQKSEAQLSNVLENASDAIISADREGRIFMWNATAEKMFGYSTEEALGKPLTLIMPKRFHKAHRAGFQRVLAGGPSHVIGKTVELVGRRKGGSEFPVELSLSKMGEGSEIYFTGIIRDLSGRKKGEEDLRQSEEQLRQAQKMETVGQLAGGVAHDFNNLLTAIIGYCELALYKLEPDNPLHKDVGEIKRAANRAATLTRQLLAFGRRQIFQPKVLNLNDVLLEMDKMLRRLIGEEIELKTVLSPSLGWARADQAQIEQVISNLILNARDAMPSGGILTLETRNAQLDENYTRNHLDTKAGTYVMVAVTDTGIGMSAETKSHLFEPFFTTKDKAKTSGLGLSTAYGIMKQSGGHISVYSELGKGSTFKVYLPRVQAEVEREEKAKQVEARPPAEKETVLLVEDEEILRDLARNVLEINGYKVLSASNGVDALSLIEKNKDPIHILVTDVVMPKMNGRELAEKLKVLRPGIKVLFMSGYTDDAMIQRGKLELGTAFLPKPFTPSVFVAKVREIME